MGIIRFILENVISCLKSKGFVYTIRGKRKHLGKVTILYKGKSIGVGEVEEIGKIDLETLTVSGTSLEKYLPYSGFSTLEDWVVAALKLNSKTGGKGLWLYKVKLIRSSRNRANLIDVI